MTGRELIAILDAKRESVRLMTQPSPVHAVCGWCWALGCVTYTNAQMTDGCVRRWACIECAARYTKTWCRYNG